MPIRTALEIGAGTGKATRAFAAAGIAVTATDPDAAMLTELRRHVPPTVTTKRPAFEDLPLTESYDLVFAAAAMHWTEPTRRWSRVAALLNEHGMFASIGGPLTLEDPAVDEAVRAVTCDYIADDGIQSPDGTADGSTLQWPGTELCRSDEFADVRQITIERRVVLSDHEYLGHLSTISSYLLLDTAVRARLFDRILDVLPTRVTLNADLTLHVARVVTSTKT